MISVAPGEDITRPATMDNEPVFNFNLPRLIAPILYSFQENSTSIVSPPR